MLVAVARPVKRRGSQGGVFARAPVGAALDRGGRRGASKRRRRRPASDEKSSERLYSLAPMKRFRPVAQKDAAGGGIACVASVLGLSYAEVLAKLGARPGKAGKAGQWPSSEALRRVLNEAFKDTGLAYEFDQPFIGDPDGLETGSIVALADGRYLMRAADGWMDPAGGKIRRQLPAKVGAALVLTPDL